MAKPFEGKETPEEEKMEHEEMRAHMGRGKHRMKRKGSRGSKRSMKR